MEFPEVDDIRVARLRPDDIVVLMCQASISAATADRLQAYAESAFGRRCVILADGLTMQIARAADVPEELPLSGL